MNWTIVYNFDSDPEYPNALDTIVGNKSWSVPHSFVPETCDSGTCTHLYFGSAVVPVGNSRTGELALGAGYQALLGFHRLYSKVLLNAARAQLNAQRT